MVSRRAFVQLLSSYALLLAIPLSLGTAVTSALVREYERQVQASRLGLLGQARQVVDGYIEDIKWRTFQISGNARLSRLLSESGADGPPNTLDLMSIVDDLNSYLLYSSSLESNFYVILRHHDVILTPYAVYSTADFQDGKTYFRMEGVSTEEWHQRLFSRYYNGLVLPSQIVTFEDFKNKPMIPYIQSLPLSYSEEGSEIEGVIVYLIGDREFTSLLENIETPNGGFCYIADADNVLLTGIGGPAPPAVSLDLPPESSQGLFRLSGSDGELFVTYTTSPMNGWRYVAAAPTSWVFAAVRRLQLISIVGLSISLLVSAALAIRIAFRQSEVLGRVFSMISLAQPAPEPAPVGFGSLSKEVNRLIASNTGMQADLKRQREFLRRNFLNRLWHGYFTNPSSLEQFKQYLGETFSEKFYTVVSIRLRDFAELNDVHVIDELNKVKVLFRSQLNGLYPGRTLSYDPEENIVSSILASSSSSENAHNDQVDRTIDAFLKRAVDSYRTRLAIGIGPTCAALTAVHRSYQRSREALPFAERSEHPVAHWTDVIHRIDGYSYPIEKEVRLMNATRSGDVESVSEIVEELRRDSFVTRTLDDDTLEQLSYEMWGTLTKIVSAVEDVEVPVDIRELGPPFRESAFDALSSAFVQIATVTNTRKRSHNSELIRAVLAFLDENYADRNLGLTMVADRFKITESYLSFFFKEQTGVNFSHHVEMIRIHASEELLRGTQLSVYEVARQVGYNSDKTFRRVFRRLKGQTPTDFRREELLKRLV
jgi:two-component system response regulator YesN